MVNYKCNRCGFTNTIKSKFISHLRRKYICKAKLSNIGIGEIYEKYFGEGVTPKHSEFTPKHSKNTPKHSETTPKPSVICKHCDRSFTRKDNLKRHYVRCKKKLEKDESKNQLNDLKKLVDLLNEQIKQKDKQLKEQLKETKKEFKEQLKEKDKRIDELIKKTGVNIGTQNNTNNTNIQNNIKILAYGKTDLSHLNDNHYMGFLNHNNFCVPYMIKKIHFDPKKPENHNIYISNMKNTYIMIWDGKKWNIKDRQEIIDDIIEDNTNILEDKIEDWINKGKNYPLIMKKFNRYLEKRENDAILNKIKLEIKFILFNNRKMIKSEI